MGYLLILLGTAITGLVLFQLFQLTMRSLAVAREAKTQRGLGVKALTAQIDLLKEMHREQEALNSLAWNGFRKFLVKQVRRENKFVSSITLVPHDGKKLPPFKPGQFLTFNLRIPGQDKAVVRCYSLSCSPNDSHYRVTIKKVMSNPRDPSSRPGLSSTYFNDTLREGDILDVKAPSGSFFLEVHDRKPVVLIAGGIGVTPVYSMLRALADREDDRDIWFFYGVRNKEELVLRDEIEEIASRFTNVKFHICASEPSPQESVGKDYHTNGRVSVELFQKTLPSNNFDFLVCGPPPMMESICSGLKTWGVPENRIHFEAFGFATVKRTSAAPDAATQAKNHFKIRYSRSNKTADWDGKATSLLDHAEANQITMASGCRAGNCGTCLVAVKAGEVSYLHEPGMKPETGTCLACVAIPKGDLELDA